MPLTAPGVIPRIKDERAYEAALRSAILNPFAKELEAAARNAGASYAAIKADIARIPQDPSLHGLSVAAATRQMTRLKEYHTYRFAQSMKRFFGVKAELLSDTAIAPFITQAITDNVALIKSIPVNYHATLTQELLKLADDKPFDRREVSKLFRDTYKKSGYSLRRLTRDQTSKTIGKLSEIRQTQAGITEYIWRISGDNRVRPTHRAHNGNTFQWANPPSDTGNPGQDIQCRCIPEAIIPTVRKARPAALRPAPRRRNRQRSRLTSPVPSGGFSVASPSRGPVSTVYEWQAASWKDTSQEFRRIVRNTPPPSVEHDPLKKAAYFRKTKTIQMGAERLHQDKKFSDSMSTWRHEFGHHMDKIAGEKRGSALMRSAADDFTNAMKDDANTMMIGSGESLSPVFKASSLKNATSTRKMMKRTGDKMEKLAGESERAKFLKELADDADVDLESYQKWLDKNGALSKYKKGSMERDTFTARSLIAWKRGHAQAWMDSIEGFRRTQKQKIISLEGRINRQIAYRNGSERHVSDLFSSATNRKVLGSASHSAEYLAVAGRRQTECWANITSVMGTGPMGEKILEKWVPRMFKVFREEYKLAKRPVSAPKPTVAPKPKPKPKASPKPSPKPTPPPEPAPAPPTPTPEPPPAPVPRETSTGIDPVVERLKIKEAQKAFMKDMDLTDEKLTKLLKEAFGDVDYEKLLREVTSADNSSVYMAIKGQSLNKIIREGGKFKNSIETGKGSFKTIGKDRFDRFEKRIFGLDSRDIDTPDNLPKYGFLSGKREMNHDKIAGAGYGANFIKFKSSVRKRATFTLENSMNGNTNPSYSATPAAPLNDPSARHQFMRMFKHDYGDTPELVHETKIPIDEVRSSVKKLIEKKDINSLESVSVSSYVEVQMYGKIDLSMVESISVQSKKYAKTLRRSLDKAGFKDIKIVSSKYHDQLHDLAHGSFSAMTSLKPEDIDRLGDFYIERILKHGQFAGVFTKRQTGIRGLSFGWSDDVFPEPIQKIRARYSDIKDVIQNASMTEKREVLKTWFYYVSRRKQGGLPKVFWKDYKSSKAGFTADVLNEDLLKSYPGVN